MKTIVMVPLSLSQAKALERAATLRDKRGSATAESALEKLREAIDVARRWPEIPHQQFKRFPDLLREASLRQFR